MLHFNTIQAMVSFFRTSLFLCAFVVTWAFPQNVFRKSECPANQCSTKNLKDFKGKPCLKLNEEIVYRCQKFKCVNMNASGSTLQPGEELGCYISRGDCIPFKSQRNQTDSEGQERMECLCDKHRGGSLIICA
ncbi:uncharacterized protein LOC112565979 [Pomacea canaliculata]|uniref:uncharacterized protein LOC112565979 n=1 Tax=Pomacea canaliculata TaxID=400727 RepID=UPI000D72ECBC|nr:uncharacterized protein LOC112565979 [Pomacea canaliculata]